MFEKFFATYTQTDQPPIKTQGYIDTYNNTDLKTNPFIDSDDLSEYFKDNVADTYQKNVDYYSNLGSDSENTTDYSSFKQVDINEPKKVSNNPILNNISKMAESYVQKVPYQWGGSTPSQGLDCSGLVQYVYKTQGINLPHSAKEISKLGKEVSLKDVQPGDVICAKSTGPTGQHMKLVTSVDNGVVTTVDAKGKKKGIVKETLTNPEKIYSIRRFVDNA